MTFIMTWYIHSNSEKNWWHLVIILSTKDAIHTNTHYLLTLKMRTFTCIFWSNCKTDKRSEAWCVWKLCRLWALSLWSEGQSCPLAITGSAVAAMCRLIGSKTTVANTIQSCLSGFCLTRAKWSSQKSSIMIHRSLQTHLLWVEQRHSKHTV